MRRTKIICTMGPACSNEETLEKMVRSGMNVARLNFSHGDYEEHGGRIQLIRTVRERLNVPLAIMLDTKGPEIRLKEFVDGRATLEDGKPFVLTIEDVEGTAERATITYRDLPKDLKGGERILIDDGKLELRVDHCTESEVHCVVVHGGIVRNRKSINIPHSRLSLPYLSEQDKNDILFGIQQNVDYIAASFTRNKEDVISLRKFLDYHGGHDIKIISKIENIEGVENFNKILRESDGIMVARGDMGVEIEFERLPGLQKRFIRRCNQAGKIVITATQMLDSMMTSASPTRAEITDVANAVFDGTSAVMLSGETAAGKYPVQAVEAMAKICVETEKHLENKYADKKFTIQNPSDALSHSACVLAEDIGAKAIVVCSRSGGTARLVSRFRPKMDIVGMTIEPQSYRKLDLSWGVIPVLSEEFTSIDVLFYHAKRAAIKLGLVKKGDRIVITGGNPNGKSGNSSVINIENI